MIFAVGKLTFVQVMIGIGLPSTSQGSTSELFSATLWSLPSPIIDGGTKILDNNFCKGLFIFFINYKAYSVIKPIQTPINEYQNAHFAMK